MIGIVFTWGSPMKQQQGKLFVLKAAVKLPPVSMTTHIFPQEACNDCLLIEVLVLLDVSLDGWHHLFAYVS
jgi:hypothetical protein